MGMARAIIRGIDQHPWLLVFVLTLGCRASGQEPANPRASTNGYVGNEACARCHAKINDSYSRTNMAHASGLAADKFIAADFTHTKSGVHYRIYQENGKVWLSFERANDSLVHGKRELLYFIGSGHRGLTYLFSSDGYVFESPINWYGDKQTWDMTPAYQDAKEIPLNLPVVTSCLHCHIGEMRTPVRGTENRYAVPLMAHSGITCERCHGPGEAHLQGGPIVNPAKLAPRRRDEVCMQCHMEGKVAIERAGHHVYEYRPGDELSKFVTYYVMSNNARLGAVSQVEALAQSTCKKKSGDSMSCTTCHEPHYSPPADERIAYYRGKCIGCHGVSFGKKHHADRPDCTECHMSRSSSADVMHTQVTDHRIPLKRVVGQGVLENVSGASVPNLIPFPFSEEAQQDVRSLALAWRSLADNGLPSARPKAEKLLRRAAVTSPHDPAVLSALGYIEQQRGNEDRARELYERALAADPDSVDAATNLGVLEARRGNMRKAVRLWQSAFERAPGESSIGMNLVRTFCQSNQFDEARSCDLRVLKFNPDLTGAKNLLEQLNHVPPKCEP